MWFGISLKNEIMETTNISGLGYRLRLHIVIPLVYFLTLTVALIIQSNH